MSIEAIYTSFWPDLWIGLLCGSSVGWPLDLVQICRLDDTAVGMDAFKSTFDGANRRSMGARGCGVIHVAVEAPGFVRFFSVLVGMIVWSKLTHLA